MKKDYFISFSKNFFKVWETLLLVLFFCLQLNAQEKPENFSCGTQIEPDAYTSDIFYGDNQKLVELLIDHNVDIDVDYLKQLEEAKDIGKLGEGVFKAIGRHYDIPIKAWVYRNNNGVGNFDANGIDQIITNLNNVFSPYNINFYLLCDISFINNSNYANNGETYFMDYTLNNKQVGALNIHFIIKSGSTWAGKANFPFQSTAFGEVLNPRGFSGAVQYSNLNNTPKVLAHEIGHILGLYHTHHPGRSSGVNGNCGDCYQESVSRSRRQGPLCISTFNKRKCEVNGDFLCDTESDPFLNFNVSYPSCTYTQIHTDNWGNQWLPNAKNIMSYTNVNCMSFFSPLQVGRMYGYIAWIGISHSSVTIYGSSALCAGQMENYTVSTVPGATSYYWEASNNYQILSGQGTATITVKAMNDYGGSVSVTPNCGTRKAKKTITSLGELPIEGYDQACPLFTYTYSAPFLSSADYEWTISNGYIVSGQYDNEVVVMLSSHSSNQSLLNVEITNHCANSIFGQKIITHGDPPFPEQQCYTVDPGKPGNTENNFDESKLLIYPNPAETSVAILNITDVPFRIMLMDLTGRIIMELPSTSEKERLLNTSELPAGVYIVRFINENSNIIKKLIIKN